MLLQSQDTFDELAEVEVETWRVKFLSKAKDTSLAGAPVAGQYSIVGGEMCSLYRAGNTLHLRIGEQEIEITDAVEARLHPGMSKNTLQVFRNGEPVIEFTYPPPPSDVQLADDPTPFISQEDFDFPLFVCNVIRDRERRQRIIVHHAPA